MNKENENPQNPPLSAAEKMYQSHLKNVAKYQQRNKEKVKEKQKRYLERMRDEPERKAAFLSGRFH